MVEVPCVSGQAPVDRVHNGVLDNVHRARDAGGEELFCPARKPIGLREEASGEKPMVRSHLPVHDVLCENVGAEGHANIWPCQLATITLIHESIIHGELSVCADTGL